MNATAYDLWRAHAKRCPKCNHSSRLVPLVHLDVYVCRWGHRIPGYELVLL